MVINKKGQSTLEYILLATAVVVVLIVFLMGNNSLFQQNVGAGITTAGNKMEIAGNKILGLVK